MGKMYRQTTGLELHFRTSCGAHVVIFFLNILTKRLRHHEARDNEGAGGRDAGDDIRNHIVELDTYVTGHG